MKKAEVTCIDCGSSRLTFSRAERCVQCANSKINQVSRDRIKVALEALGHENVVFDGFNKYGKVGVSFLHPICGTQQTWAGGNITKQLAANPTIAPCSHCGSKRRTAEATRISALNNGVPDHLLPEWEAYRRTVRRLTEQTYRKYKLEINPLNLRRSLGSSGFHLDHKQSIIDGFDKGIPPEVLAHKSNLQMLSGPENISKGRKSVIYYSL